MASKKIKCINGDDYKVAAQEQADSIIAEAKVWAAIQTAMMLAQRSSASGIADMQAELAERRVALAEEALAHAKLTWAKEAEFVAEMMGVPVFTPQYSQVSVMLNETDRVETIAVDAIDARLARFGISSGSCDDSRTSRGMATARTDLVSHSMRAAEARAIALNDRRYSRQLAAVGMGRGTLQAAREMGTLADQNTGIRDSLIRTINSGMSLWGYTANRWRHGGNYATGERGAPVVVPRGQALVQTSDVNGNMRLNIMSNSLANAVTGQASGITVNSEAATDFSRSEY